MNSRHLLFQLPLVLTLLAPAAPAVAADPVAPKAAAMTFSFAGTAYFHRWSQRGQHEFTPQKQTDLAKWNDMVTLTVAEAATTAEKVAEIANRTLALYQQNGRVLKKASRPASADRTAEHLIVAVFAQPEFLEASLARIVFVDGVGLTAVYSHRIYGKDVGAAMSKWLEKSEPDAERALMGWSDFPKPSSRAAFRIRA